MKVEVGMYVRFKTLSNEVKIGQIQLIDNIIYELDNNEVTADKYIIKASHNIIDLIEVGDYVNGVRIDELSHNRFTNAKAVATNNSLRGDTGKQYWFENEDIKSIVTKEQFESIKYSLEG